MRKKIVLREIDKGATYDKYGEPLFRLSDSMICNLCYKCNDPNVGFSLNKNNSEVKCYLGDTGLLVSLAFSENELAEYNLYKQIMDGKFSINQGMIYENSIAQMIASKEKKLFFFTKYNPEKPVRIRRHHQNTSVYVLCCILIFYFISFFGGKISNSSPGCPESCCFYFGDYSASCLFSMSSARMRLCSAFGRA